MAAKNTAPKVNKADDRSLGFIPMLLATLIWIFLTNFTEVIGPMTSASGFFVVGYGPPLYGCIIPKAKP